MLGVDIGKLDGISPMDAILKDEKVGKEKKGIKVQEMVSIDMT